MFLILFMLFIFWLVLSFSSLKASIIPNKNEERWSAFITFLFVFPPGGWILISLINNYKIDVFFEWIFKIILRDIIIVISFLTIKWIFNKIKELIKYIAKSISRYDEQWYWKKDWYNRLWWNRDWINKYTWTKYDEEWYNRQWWNRYKINKYTGNKFDAFWYDWEWFNKEWWFTFSYKVPEFPNYRYWTNKKTKTLFDEDWYDIKWYDENWFDKYWKHKDTKDYYNKEWYDKDGFNKKWWNKKWINKYTRKKYDKYWYNMRWEDREWFNRSWINDEWMDKRGFPHKNDYYTWKWLYEWWDNIFTWTKYDKNWLDYYWNPKETKKITKKFTNKDVSKNVKGSKIKEKIESLKICSIASWSNWNCYYIWTDDKAILIDDWISYKQLSLRMKEVNLDINSVKWIFISHEHVDHIKWLPIFYKNHPNIPIYFNEKAYRSVSYSNNPSAYRGWVVNLEERVVNLAWFKIYPFKKKHDASYPLSFRVEYNWISVWIFTDIWEHSTTFRNHFSKCNAVFLEANHDVTMLRNCSRPRDVIERIYETHFSNDNAYDMLNDYANPDLQVVILVHISEDNNSNRKIMEKFAKFEKKYKLEIASRYGVWKVYEIMN